MEKEADPISNSSEHLTIENDELNTEWCLWWRFVPPRLHQAYDSSKLQQICSFSNLSTFAQIYNGSNLGKISSIMTETDSVNRAKPDSEKGLNDYPVDCAMLFRKGIVPEWEDPKNAFGSHFVYEIMNPVAEVSDAIWKEFSCY